MATQGQVTKIYELRTLGFKDISKELTAVNDLFEKIKKSKLSAQGKLAAAQDISDIKKYADEVAKLQVQEQKLRTKRQQMINDQKAAQIQRQAEIQQEKQRVSGLKDSSGWYYKLTSQIKELGIAIKSVNNPGDNVSFRGQSLQYDQAITKLKELTTAEQDFRRQFAKDGLLVAEYSSGIVQAFKQMGLDDLIGGQITKGQQRIKQLDTEFEKLKQELSSVGVSGEGNLQKIEKELIDNRKEVITLTQSVAQLQNEYRGVGDVGNQVSLSLKNGFKEIKSQLTSFVVGYLGFQSIFSGITKTFNDTVKLDSLSSSLKVVSENEQELATNTEFLKRVTDELGLEYISTSQAFKNFYASSVQAGIGVDETRQIFESTAKAAANLKLSQEDTNGVLLAFSQIASKGKVQAEELRGQIGERLPGAFAIAARAMGVSQKELNKMLETGQVVSSEFLPKFAAELERTFGGNANSKVEGLQANINRLKNEFTQLILDNQEGLSSFFSVIISGAGILIKLLPLLVVALSLYTAEQVRAYLATKLTTEGTYLFRLAQIASAVQTRVMALALKIATYELVLFNGAMRISPFGIFLTALTVIIPTVALFANRIKEAKTAQDALNDTTRKASEMIAEQTTNLNKWYTVALKAAQGGITQRNAVEELIKISPKFRDAIQGETIDLQKLKIAYNEVAEAIKKKSFALASSELATEAQKKVNEVSALQIILETEFATGKGTARTIKGLTDEQKDILFNGLDQSKSSIRRAGGGDISFLEYDFPNIIKRLELIRETRSKSAEKYFTLAEKFRKDIESENNKVTGPVGRTIDLIKKDLEQAEKDFNSSVVGSTEYKSLKQKVIDLRKELSDAEIKDNKSNTYRGSRLTGAQKDAFKDIEAIRDQELAIERKKRLENTIDEETYLKNVLRINGEAITKKLNIIKGANAEERKQIAELNLERITNEQETNQKIFDLRIENRKAELEQIIRDANEAANAVANNPQSTPGQIAKARLDADNKILAAQIQFGKDLDVLEKQLGQQSVQNEKQSADEIAKTKQQLAEDEKKLLEARIEDIRINGEKEVSQINIDFAKVRAAILANDKLTATQKAAQIERLSKLENFTLISAEVKRLAEEFRTKEEQYKKGLISEDAYLKAKADLEAAYNKQQEAKNDLNKTGNIQIPSSQSSQNLLKDQLSKAFGFKDGSAESQLLGNVLGQSFDLAKDSMNAYFDAEEARIRNSLNLSLERIDKEKQLALTKAQSQNEIASIEKQYAAKKQQAEKEAGEQLKKSKRSEAAIALASELANIAVAAAANPANGVTFGSAGAIMYGILAAIALGKYQLRVNEINRQQFEFGGDVPTRGGEFGGKPHGQGGTPFSFQGRSYEAEVGEMSVIRTKNAPRNRVFNIVGTQRQIASALNQIGGGVSFATGARVNKFAFGGNLGETLQAPVFMPHNNTVFYNSNNEMLNELKQMRSDLVAMANEQSNRIDRLEVVQVTSTVTKAQRKEIQQAEIATL